MEKNKYDATMSEENAETDSPVVKDCPNDASISLMDLPVEIFLHICSFMDTPTLVHSLGLVCKKFYEILNDESLWKARIGQIWQNARYPVLPPDDDDELSWRKSCVAIEKHLSYWSDMSSVEESRLPTGHSAIDTLMLVNLQNRLLLITGGRDRSLCCWNLNSGSELWQCDTKHLSHAGWIWGLTAVDKTFYSCSWDKTVKSWHIDNCHLAAVRKFKMGVTSALLCVASCPGTDILATGSHCRNVVLFDPRAEEATIARYEPHRRAVLKIVMNENYVLSASEDRTVAVWDQRAGKIMKTIEISKDGYPMSMIMQKGSVLVGDSSGNLHILDSKKDFEIAKSYASGHTKGIKGLSFTPSSLITGSLDKTVRLSSPTDPPQLITSLPERVGEIADMDYLNGVLAISGSHVHIWRPIET